MTTLGSRLTYLREKRGWTKTYVAEKLNIKTVSTYANWEYDLRQPDNDMLVKIAVLFEVSTDYLLGRTGTPALTPQEKDEAAFQAFANDPELNVFYKELPESDEEAVRKLRNIWEIIKNEKK
ncbi:helix-turn-helix domain-containing protein [Lysinibacillus sphaericus]|uniref:helix-turn-helix domain-containing protein n=1 Tax=Lysinibacillus sphaericus TaxID=1421 RepID=UPI003F79B31C